MRYLNQYGMSLPLFLSSVFLQGEQSFFGDDDDDDDDGDDDDDDDDDEEEVEDDDDDDKVEEVKSMGEETEEEEGETAEAAAAAAAAAAVTEACFGIAELFFLSAFCSKLFPFDGEVRIELTLVATPTAPFPTL